MIIQNCLYLGMCGSGDGNLGLGDSDEASISSRIPLPVKQKDSFINEKLCKVMLISESLKENYDILLFNQHIYINAKYSSLLVMIRCFHGERKM